MSYYLGPAPGGDAQPDSDYDVAVFLKGMDGPSDRWAELHKLADPCVKFIDETGLSLRLSHIRQARTAFRSPLMHEIRREGLALSSSALAARWSRPIKALTSNFSVFRRTIPPLRRTRAAFFPEPKTSRPSRTTTPDPLPKCHPKRLSMLSKSPANLLLLSATS